MTHSIRQRLNNERERALNVDTFEDAVANMRASNFLGSFIADLGNRAMDGSTAHNQMIVDLLSGNVSDDLHFEALEWYGDNAEFIADELAEQAMGQVA